jgi:hypothetical protein
VALIDTAILRPPTNRDIHIRRDKRDHQAWHIGCRPLGSIGERDAPVQVFGEPGDDVGFVEAGAVAFFDFLFLVR